MQRFFQLTTGFVNYKKRNRKQKKRTIKKKVFMNNLLLKHLEYYLVTMTYPLIYLYVVERKQIKVFLIIILITNINTTAMRIR